MRPLLLLIIMVLLSSCEAPPPDGRIRVKNDIQDRSYNEIKVVGGGAYKTLKPKESMIMPAGTTTITMTRAYKDYVRTYRVQCPPMKRTDDGFTIKMIDAHLNRLSGGCKTVYASKN